MDECMRERYGLAKERIREIRTEETVKEPFGDFFRKMAQFLSMTADVMDEESVELTLEELKERNHHFYQDILPENYDDHEKKQNISCLRHVEWQRLIFIMHRFFRIME